MKTLMLKYAVRGTACALLWIGLGLPVASHAEPAGVQDGALIDIVGPRDTLYDIAANYLAPGHDWRDLQRFNQIGTPRRLAPGERIRLPLAWIASEPSPATVLYASGPIALILGSQASMPLRPGMTLNEGSRIRSEAGGNATLALIDGSKIRISQDTALVLQRLRKYRHTQIVDVVTHFDQGGVESSVDPGHHGVGRFEVTSPLAVTGVRGTRFRVALDSGQPGQANEVLQGVVGVQGSPGNERQVQAGEGTIVGRDGTVGAPRKLLPPPDLSDTAMAQQRPIVRFSYAALPGASAYRAYVARDKAADDVVQAATFRTPTAKFSGLPDGDYFLAVGAVDDVGLEGRRQIVPFHLKARPEIPVIVTPGGNQPVAGPAANLQWGEVETAGAYRFELAGTPSFGTPLRNERVTRGHVRLTGLAPGHYYWRVASIGKDGALGAYSAPQALSITAQSVQRPEMQSLTQPLPAPRLAWPDDGAASYRLELARDPAFGDIVASTTATAPQASLPPLSAGIYYLRIRSIDADGFEGESTAPQRIRLGAAGASTTASGVRYFSAP